MRTLLLLILVFAATFPLNAQEATDEPAACTSTELIESVSAMMRDLLDIQTLATAADLPGSLTALQAFQLQVDALVGQCVDGELPADAPVAAPSLTFEGRDARTLGPVTVPAGTYRVEAEISGWAIMSATRLSGTCGLTFSERNSLVMATEAGRQEGLFQSQGCEIVIEVNGGDAWTLKFVRIA